ncbi:MAG: AzlC family ABC transporter permease [Acidimicrobiales bacterium]
MHHFRAPGARRFVSASLVIGVAFVVFGMSFGVLAVGAGATVAQTCVMSLFVFTGASQLSVVSVIGAGGSAASAFGGAVLLAGRNAVYGLALSPLLRGSLVSRLVGTQWVIDETTALVTAEHDPAARRTAFWVSAPILYAAWNLGTLLGALAGNSIDPSTYGLDVAAPVMFTAMIVPHLRTRNGRRAAAFGAASSVLLVPFLPVGLPILVAAFGILFGLQPEPTEGADA